MADCVVFAVTWFFLFMMGASVFSFLNVVAYRVPRGMDFVRGRSQCPSCGKMLAPWQMIPVFNWLYLRGKCHYCGSKIPIRYPLFELVGGALLVFCAAYRSLLVSLSGEALLQTVTDFALLCVLTLILTVDAETMEIPNGFVIALLAVGAVMALVYDLGAVDRLVGAACASVPIFIIALCIEGAFGGGDVKLLAAAGFCLGWKLTLLALFLAILGGGFWGIYLLSSKKSTRKDHFAFGPFICAGVAISYFYGNAILDWYLGLL